MTNPYKLLFYATIFFAVILAPLTVTRPYLVQIMVDKHIITGNLTGISWLVNLYIIFVLISVIIRYFFIYCTALLGNSVVRDFRTRVFNHISNLRLSFFDKTPIGRITTRTISDIEAINTVFGQGIITIVADVLSVFAVLAVMFYTSWRLTLICLITLPFLIIATYIFKENVKAAYQNVRVQISNMNAFLQERISGMRIIQIFNVEQQELNKFREINRAYTQANLKSILYYAVFFPVVELISAVSLALLVWWGVSSYLEDHVTFGSLVAFPIYLTMLFRPVRMLADKFNTLQMGLVAAERVFDIVDTNDVINTNGRHKSDKLAGRIEFKDVTFTYDGESDVLHKVNFIIEPGETLAIVGSTGSGKTTIINILNRFYEIKSGQILIDEVPVGSYDLNYLRSRFAMVLQDVFLFDGTLKDNITLMNDEFTIEEVIDSSKLIGAHDFFKDLPDKYDFKITERGSNLSMGQRQLVSFVRSIITSPDVLILDEATSSIDSETEQVIQYAIEKLIDKRTSIIIAHRLSTIRQADKILVLDHGKVIEYGSQGKLLDIEDGHFKKLYDLQFVSE